MLTIVIIDDDLDFCELVANQLDWHRVIAAHDAASGIAEIRKHLPHLVLLDIHLPGTDGFEVLQFLKSQENLRTIPVVMLTSDSSRNSIQRAAAIGAQDYFVKPIARARIQKKIMDLVSLIDHGRSPDRTGPKIWVVENDDSIVFTFMHPIDVDTATEFRKICAQDRIAKYPDGRIALDFRYQPQNDAAVLRCAVASMAYLEPRRCALIAGSQYGVFVCLPIDIERELFISLEDFENSLLLPKQ